MAGSRFTAFSALMAVACLTYHAQLESYLGLNLATASMACAALVLLRPSSVARFLVLMLVETAFVYVLSPETNTNNILTSFAGLTIVAAAVPLLIGRRGGLPDGGALLAASGPALRLELVIVYLWSFWHKLNTGFLDPSTSCARDLYEQLWEFVSFLPLPRPETVTPTVIYGTIVLEAALPLLLVVPRTRKLGVATAWVFHWFLGLAGFYSFSATMMALAFLFAPDGTAERVHETFLARLPWFRGKGKRTLAAIGAVVATAFLVAMAARWVPGGPIGVNLRRPWLSADLVAAWLWWLAAIPVLLGVAALRTPVGAPDTVRELLVPRSALGWVLPALVLFNGACPYLGLKTESCFAMYSNLRTEGGVSNHVIIRRPVALGDYQTDLVFIRESSDPFLAGVAKELEPIPFLRLRRHVQAQAREGVTDLTLTYVRGDEVRTVEAAERDPVLMEPMSWLERKFMRFRDIRVVKPNTCTH